MRTFLITMKNGDQRKMFLIDEKSTAEKEVQKWEDSDDVVGIEEVTQ